MKSAVAAKVGPECGSVEENEADQKGLHRWKCIRPFAAWLAVPRACWVK